MRSIKENFRISAVGAIMGIAEAIPGVSGGTIAFIFRIYQELLDTIKSFHPENLKYLLKGNLSEFYTQVNGRFLIFLLGGMALGLVIGVFGISYMLESQKEPLWAFFFGLVLASSIYLSKDLDWNMLLVAFFIAGAIVTYSITLMTPSAGSDNLFYIFLAGMLAISALMLPGLSGSFILLLLGLYTQIIGTLKKVLSEFSFDYSLVVLGIFGLGCLTGLFSFSRVLSYTFKNYYAKTMAFLIGVLIGSLNKLWPWKQAILLLDKDSGELLSWEEHINRASEHIDIVKEINLLPQAYSDYSNPKTLLVIISFVLGLAAIGALHFYDKRPS